MIRGVCFFETLLDAALVAPVAFLDAAAGRAGLFGLGNAPSSSSSEPGAISFPPFPFLVFQKSFSIGSVNPSLFSFFCNCTHQLSAQVFDDFV